MVEHRSPKPGVGSSSLSARAKIYLFSAGLAVFILPLLFYCILVYSGYAMRIGHILEDLIIDFFASFIIGGFILWIISFFIAKKVKKENFTFVNFMIILIFVVPSLWVIIGSIIYVMNSVCHGEIDGYRCSAVMLNLFFWFYPIHFALPLIFAISRKKSKLQKLESQKFKR